MKHRFPSGYITAGLIWFGAVGVTTVIVISLLRSLSRNWIAWIALAVSCAVAAFGVGIDMPLATNLAVTSYDED